MYNVASYVDRCIRSLENQDIEKVTYEIICIDDGSPDNCVEVVENLQREFDNIMLIKQLNQGVSIARNNGIKIASGKYVLFIDPDDYVDPNCFNRVLDTADKCNAQVSFLGFTILDEFGNPRNEVLKHEFMDDVFSGIKAYFMARGDGRSDPDRIWAVLLESMFLKRNNLHYLPEVPYLEDGELIARIMCLAEICIFDGHPFYKRTIRQGSATNSRLFNSEKAINGFVKSAVNLSNFRNEMPLSMKQKEFLNQPVVKFVVLSIASTSKLSGLKMFLKVRSILRENNFYKLHLEGCNNRYTKLGGLYNTSIIVLYMYLLTEHALRFFRNSLREKFRSLKSPIKPK